MGGLNPQGVQVTSFKQPTSEELHHDFLWRVNKALPPRGSIAIFNRSYYEDVLVVQVHDLQKTYQMARACWKTVRRTFLKSATARSAAMKNTCTRTATAWSKSFCTFPRTNRKSAFRAH